MGTSIFECFNMKLPEYILMPETAKQAEKYKAKASSEFTKEQEPPKLFIHQAAGHWVARAAGFFNSLDEYQKKLLKASTVAQEEVAKAQLRTEADVVRVASLYLTHPLGIAINVKYNANITQRMEVKQDQCRLDLSFGINQDNEASNKTLMIIEFKRMGLLKANEFKTATILESQVKATLADMKRKRLTTLLLGASNALWFVKQTTAYSEKYSCKYVALCDYKTLILLRYGDSDGYVRIDILENGDEFRKNLLGFLDEASEDRGLEKR
jgi:hypothetical protein